MTEAEAVLVKLKEIGKDLGKENITDTLAQILDNASKNGGNFRTLLTKFGRIGLGVKDMLDPNPVNKCRGLIAVVSAIRDLVVIFETPAREFAQFVSSVLFVGQVTSSCAVSGLDGIQKGNAIAMLTKVISDTLDSHGDAMIKSNVDSTCRVFSFAHNVIIGACSDSDKSPSRSDISDLIQMIDIKAGIKTLGKIESRISSLMENQPKAQSEEAVSTYTERVLKYIDMYCHLAILRDAVMLEFYALLTSSGHSGCLAEGVRAGLKGEHERDRNLVKSLVLPNQKHVRFASFFDPDRWPFTFKFMEDCKDLPALENLDKVPIAMRTMKWMNWFATHDTSPAICLRSLKSSLEKPLDKTKHNFVLLKKEVSSCYYICPQNQDNKYVVMREGNKKWVDIKCGKPGREGEWNIFNVQDNDSMYMLVH
ncbi:uncharacterized protein LOC117335812 isoform X2 [Pecten maximus]|nr:uncharacterized protein LOC117335812 isoform X2 [Pecten maximus]XP_033751907.1 uncharacterized protein LOC117335812 isoform X2 [Pecten maximus]